MDLVEQLYRALLTRPCNCEYLRAGNLPVWQNGQRTRVKQCSRCVAAERYEKERLSVD